MRLVTTLFGRCKEKAKAIDRGAAATSLSINLYWYKFPPQRPSHANVCPTLVAYVPLAFSR